MTREALHRLVDELPETHLGLAEQTLESIRDAENPVVWSLEHAPLDDEPETEEERRAVEAARAEADRGELIPHEEVKRRWGLAPSRDE